MAPTEGMTVLQIWLGEKPSDARLKAMYHTLDWSREHGHNYKLIGDTNILNMGDSARCEFTPFVDFLKYEDELRDLLGCCKWRDDRTKLVVTSDFVRLFYLAENENTLYVDTDAMVNPPLPEFTVDKPWFASYGPQMIDSILIHGNGQQVLWEIIDAMIMMSSRDGVQKPMLWDLHIVLNGFREYVNTIPQECFIHKVKGS
jgi:hypothetical protein